MNPTIVDKIEKDYLKKVPELRAGDVVRVHQKIKEGNKERIQIFEGVVLKVTGSGIKKSFLVRKISFGIGVEKSYLVHSPNIAKIEVKKRSNVRQGYLTYLRQLTGKSARLKDKQFDILAVNIKDEPEETLEESKPGKKEKVTDAEITELSEEEVAEAEADEVPIEEVAEEEKRKGDKEDKEGRDPADADEQVAQQAEVGIGLDRADEDSATGTDTFGGNAEKVKEALTDEDIKDDVAQQKESE